MHAVSQEDFEGFVNDGVAAIPDRFRRLIANVAFLVEDAPTPSARRKMKLRRDETLFGLYEGVPRIVRGVEYGGLALPDRITIFKQPIEEEAEMILRASAPNPTQGAFKEEARRIVIDTVWHEIAHHFGLNENAVRRREIARRNARRLTREENVI